MPYIHISNEEFEQRSRDYYKHLPGDVIVVFGLDQEYKAKVKTVYTSDQFNHPAAPHKRYIVEYMINGKVWDGKEDDVSELEVDYYRGV